MATTEIPRQRRVRACKNVGVEKVGKILSADRDFRGVDADLERVFVVEYWQLIVAHGNQRAIQGVNLHRDAVAETIVHVAHLRANSAGLLFRRLALLRASEASHAMRDHLEASFRQLSKIGRKPGLTA